MKFFDRKEQHAQLTEMKARSYENHSMLNEFASEIRAKLDLFVPSGITSFGDIYTLLMEAGVNRKFTLVIDEFQNFDEVNPSVFSDIQKTWDKYRLRTHVNMVVSGFVYIHWRRA